MFHILLIFLRYVEIDDNPLRTWGAISRTMVKPTWVEWKNIGVMDCLYLQLLQKCHPGGFPMASLVARPQISWFHE